MACGEMAERIRREKGFKKKFFGSFMGFRYHQLSETG